MINNNPIGLFDSGIGGTSIWKEIHQLLPNEDTIYLADSKNAPYGEKTKEEIIHLSCKNTEYLLNQNCKIIVVACNTATTNAIKELRAKYEVPFIGIEPAIKPEMKDLLTQYLSPMIEANIDYLVLGCSHYPYLIPQIKKILPNNIKIIDSGEAVAKQTKKILIEKVGLRELNKKSTTLFYTNTNPKVLSEILENKYTVIQNNF